jgi:hypothetical protein
MESEMTDEGTPKEGADSAAKQRKQAIRKKARELASQQGKEWTSVPKEERKTFRKAAQAAAPGDLSSPLRKASGSKEPREAGERTGSEGAAERLLPGRNPKRKKPTT